MDGDLGTLVLTCLFLARKATLNNTEMSPFEDWETLVTDVLVESGDLPEAMGSPPGQRVRMTIK